MARDIELPMEVAFSGEQDGRWSLKLTCCSDQISKKRIRFTERGLQAMTGDEAVPICVKSHDAANEDILLTVGFSEHREVSDGMLVANGYLIQGHPQAQLIWELAQSDKNYAQMVGSSICGTISLTDATAVRRKADVDGPYIESDVWGKWKHILLCPSSSAAIPNTSTDWGEALIAATLSETQGELTVEDNKFEITEQDKDAVVAFLGGGLIASGDNERDPIRVMILQDLASDFTVTPGTSPYGNGERSGGVGQVIAGPAKEFPPGSTVLWMTDGTPIKVTKEKQSYTLVRPYDVLFGWEANSAGPFTVAQTENAPVTEVSGEQEERPSMPEQNESRVKKFIEWLFGQEEPVEQTEAPTVATPEPTEVAQDAGISDADVARIADEVLSRVRAAADEQTEAEPEPEPVVEQTEPDKTAELQAEIEALKAKLAEVAQTVPLSGQEPIKPNTPTTVVTDKASMSGLLGLR